MVHLETKFKNVSGLILCYRLIWEDYRRMKCLNKLKRWRFLNRESVFMLTKHTKSYRNISFLKDSVYFILNSSCFKICPSTHPLTFCSQWFLASTRLLISSSKLKSLVKISERNGSNSSSYILTHSSNYFYEKLIFLLINSSFKRTILFYARNASNFSLLVFNFYYNSICFNKICRSLAVSGWVDCCKIDVSFLYDIVSIF